MSPDIHHNEDQLLRMLSRGDHLAFGHLFNAHKDKLYSFIFNLTGSQATAQDVVQDVFLKVWQNRETLVSVGNFGGYLFTAARNHAINGLRRNGHIHQIVARLSTGQTEPDNAESLFSAKELRTLMERALAGLPSQQRRVFELSRNEGLKYEEIAASMGISVSTVRNHMVQALKSIREFIRSNYPVMLLIYAFA